MTNQQLEVKRAQLTDTFNGYDICFNFILASKPNEVTYLSDLTDPYITRYLYKDAFLYPNAVSKAPCCHLKPQLY